MPTAITDIGVAKAVTGDVKKIVNNPNPVTRLRKDLLKDPHVMRIPSLTFGSLSGP